MLSPWPFPLWRDEDELSISIAVAAGGCPCSFASLSSEEEVCSEDAFSAFFADAEPGVLFFDVFDVVDFLFDCIAVF